MKARAILLLCVSLLIIGWPGMSFGQDKVEREQGQAKAAAAHEQEAKLRAAFLGLAKTEDRETVRKNFEFLSQGGVAALHFLGTQLDNRTIAHSTFNSTSKMEVTQDGHILGFKPVTLGEVAFDRIQYQIEGPAPLLYRRDFLLTQENAGEWLAARQDKSLGELKMEAAKTCLERAIRKDKEESTDYSRGLVALFKERVAELEQTAASADH